MNFGENLNKSKIGIIGYGKFGQLLYEIFKKTIKGVIKVYSPSKKPNHKAFVSLRELAEKSNLIIPVVPIRAFDSVIGQLSKFALKPGTVMMDVCSVKMYPVKVMKEKLPENVNIIATHPMFGPATYKKRGKKLQDLKMVMSKVRCDEKMYSEIKNYFKSLGLKIIEISPKEHDRLIARSQFIAQTLRWLLQDLGYSPTKIDTASAEALWKALKMIGANRELYMDLIEYNPFAREELAKMIQKMNEFKEYL